MPRIRTIKPEFCTSEQVAECSTTARLLFVELWCFCDDAGRHPANLKRLKMECFPGDSFTDDDMGRFVGELKDTGLLVEYEYEGKRFWQVTGWKHQKIDKPNYKYGPFDDDGNPAKFDDHSTTIRRPFDDHSPPEGKGRESTGKEGSLPDDSSLVEESTSEQYTAFAFPVVGGKEKTWRLTQKKMNEWSEAFPDMDVENQVRKALQWVRDNPARRKTAGGMHKFLGGWLSRNQNGAHGVSGRDDPRGNLAVLERLERRDASEPKI